MATPQRYKLPSRNRLKLRKDIETLFQTGKAFSVFPFRIIYQKPATTALQPYLKFGISVPKKRIPKAVKRNLLKRRIREAWRQEQHLILDNILANEQGLHCFIIYIGPKELPDYTVILTAIRDIIAKLQQTLNS